MLNKFDKLAERIDKDLFSSCIDNKVLHIIDDYNINHNMSETYMKKLVNAISSVKDLNRVVFYIQYNRKRKDAEQALFKATDKTNIINLNKNFENKKKLIDLFEKKGILCYFVVYPSFNVRPPFHGRYWFSEHAGYIVDGSICTATEKTVLAQLMDDENFTIIKNMTRRIIHPEKGSGVNTFNKYNIDDAYNKLVSK